ncbi:MAG: 4Fe-4S cluster-binding domain-containing protein [Actinomycetota bacterium]
MIRWIVCEKNRRETAETKFWEKVREKRNHRETPFRDEQSGSSYCQIAAQFSVDLPPINSVFSNETQAVKANVIDFPFEKSEKPINQSKQGGILNREPFDQTEGLAVLVERLKEQCFHLTIYTGFTLESLLARNSESVNRILANTDLLIDGAYDRTLTKRAGEYRGSSNQRLIFYPILRQKNERRNTKKD